MIIVSREEVYCDGNFRTNITSGCYKNCGHVYIVTSVAWCKSICIRKISARPRLAPSAFVSSDQRRRSFSYWSPREVIMGERKSIPLFFFLVLVFSKAENQAPKGHLQPLGSHQPPEKFLETKKEVPQPEQFFKNYVLPGVPLLFKGAAKTIPAYSKWSDEYLRYVIHFVFILCDFILWFCFLLLLAEKLVYHFVPWNIFMRLYFNSHII